MDLLRDDGACFVCGLKNSSGLQVTFEGSGGKAEASFIPSPSHQGYAGIVHGGILSSLLDEAMIYALMLKGETSVTATMEVQYRSFARVGEKLHLSASVLKDSKRRAIIESLILGEDGRTVAKGKGVYVKVPCQTGRPA